MNKSKRVMMRGDGFTIIELLTVMGVIGILMSLLVPALNLVYDHAKKVQQQGQFHSIDVALGLYKSEFGNLPSSRDNSLVTFPGVLGADPSSYGGAQKLTESLVGLDFLGVHPKSTLRSDGRNAIDINNDGVLEIVDVYDTTGPIVDFQSSGEENIQARKGPFIDLENASAFQMQDVYQNFATQGFLATSLVLCDEYAEKRPSGKKTGMPILYYRANTRWTQQDCLNPATAEVPGGLEDDIYDYRDNLLLLQLGAADTSGSVHPLAATGNLITDCQKFEEIILNDQVTAIRRPYNANSYILISAGKDGLYGNGDDVYNFVKDD